MNNFTLEMHTETVCLVRIDDLQPTDKYITMDKIGYETSEPIEAIRTDEGDILIADGHTRVRKSFLEGNTFITAIVRSLSYYDDCQFMGVDYFYERAQYCKKQGVFHINDMPILELPKHTFQAHSHEPQRTPLHTAATTH